MLGINFRLFVSGNSCEVAINIEYESFDSAAPLDSIPRTCRMCANGLARVRPSLHEKLVKKSQLH